MSKSSGRKPGNRTKPKGNLDCRVVTREQMNIQQEARYIIQRAQQRDGRIVTICNLILFSTESGDAWMLDPEDHFALCLAQDGQEQPYHITETPTNFAIERNADYQIEGEAFIVMERSGRIRTILGYPTAEIEMRSN